MEKIVPTSTPEKDKGFVLEDWQYCLTKAIQELTIAIKQMTMKL